MGKVKDAVYRWYITRWPTFLLAAALAVTILILFFFFRGVEREGQRETIYRLPVQASFGNKLLGLPDGPYLVEGHHFGFPGPKREMMLLVCSQLSASQEIVASFEEWAPVAGESPYRKYTKGNTDDPDSLPICRNERGVFHLVKRVEQRQIILGDRAEVFNIVEVKITSYIGTVSWEASGLYHIARIPVFSEREYFMWYGGDEV